MVYPSLKIGSSKPGYQQVAAATGGLASAEYWTQSHQQSNRDSEQRRSSGKQPELIFDFNKWATSENDFPDEVLFEFPHLDNNSRNFLKHGARSAAEQLAYAQQVNPLAHLDAIPASQEIQRNFQKLGDLDRQQHFVGPDGRVYLRNEDSEELEGAKVRRAFEQAIGGFEIPDIKESLRRISEATRSKRADVELYDAPTLPEQEDRELFLAPFHVNPTTWQSGNRAPEYLQKSFQDAPNLWHPYPTAYLGPDGVVYEKNELTVPEPFGEWHRVREEFERQQFIRTLPPPTDEDIYWRLIEEGPATQRGRFRSPKGPHGKFVSPGGEEARAAIRERLEGVPGQVASLGLGNALLSALRRKRRRDRGLRGLYYGGSRGNQETQEQIEDLTAFLEKHIHAKRLFGGRDAKGNKLKELYIPNPAKDFAELLGMKVIDGRLGSNKIDLTLELPNGKWVHIQTADIDPKTGKVAEYELDRALKIFRRTGQMVLVYPKRYQLEKFRREMEILRILNE